MHDGYQPNAQELQAGRVQIATAAQIAAGTRIGSTGAILVVPADLVGPGGVGNVVGPASSTDNAVTRFDGATGLLIQNSVVTMSDSGLMTWTSAGQAITAGSYQIGRDADATNNLHLNVPTGAGMEMSVNDVGALVIASTRYVNVTEALAVGTSSPASTTLDVRGNVFIRSTDVSAAMTGNVSRLVNTEFNVFPAGATDTEYRGYSVDIYTSAAAGNITGAISSFRSMVRIEANHTFSSVNGALFVIDLDVGTITEGAGLRVSQDYSGGAIGTSYGIVIPAIVGAVVPTTAYGLKVDSPGIGTTQWTMYSTSGDNAFGGNSRFGGVTAPTVAVDVTGSIRATSSLILEETGAGTDAITIQAPAAIAASYTITLPEDDGAAGQFLKTDGSGVTSWDTPAGTGDITSVGDVASGAAFDGTQGTTLTFFNGGGNMTVAYDGTTLATSKTLKPSANDGAALGLSGTAFSDLFLASGGVINWNAGDVTLTHSTNTLTTAGFTSLVNTQAVASSGTPVGFSFVSALHTTLDAGVPLNQTLWNFSNAVQFATGDINDVSIAFRINGATTYSFVGASAMAAAATFSVDGMPQASTNATLEVAVGSQFSGGNGSNASSLNATTIFEFPQLLNGTGSTDISAAIYVPGDTFSLSNQTATTTYANGIRIEAVTLTSTTNTRTITNPAALYVESFIAGTNVAFTNSTLAAHFVGDVKMDGTSMSLYGTTTRFTYLQTDSDDSYLVTSDGGSTTDEGIHLNITAGNGGTSGLGGAGGDVNITTGDGGGTRSGGTLRFTTGLAGQTINGFSPAGGNMIWTTGNGEHSDGVTAGGGGGSIQVTTGNGGNSSGAVSGGKGGDFSFVLGNGGGGTNGREGKFSASAGQTSFQVRGTANPSDDVLNTFIDFDFGAYSALTADTELAAAKFRMNQNWQWTAGGGTFTNQRFAQFLAPTIAFTSADTITNTATVYVDAAPIAGTNATLTNSYALWVDDGASRFDDRILGFQGADTAAANDLTLPKGNSVEITGATQINAIVTTGWTLGSIVTLIFASTPTVKHNTAGGAGTAVILLAGAADFVASAGDTLTLIYSEQGGTNAWREFSRAVI